jgi:hypothetical protein
VTVPVSAANNISNTFDDNVYYAASGSASAQWSWNNATETGFAKWKSASKQDAHSVFANPQFIQTGTNPDLDVKSTSPAVKLAAGSNVPMK